MNEDRHNVQKGMMVVSNTDLTYTNSRTLEQLEWPLKYLRKYGCDGDVFSFEAGRKCPGGEGLYAFNTKKASQLFELVARNINQGNLQPPSDLSPVTLEATRTLISRLGQSPEASQVSLVDTSLRLPPTSHTSLPLASLGQTGAVSSEAAAIPPPLPEPRGAYPLLRFDKESDLYPPPPASNATSKYATIDFDGTDQAGNSRKRNGTTPNSARPPRGGRKHSQTFSGGTKGPRKPSQSSVDSHSSLTESTCDPVVVSPNSSIFLPAVQNYQNVVVGEQGLQVVDSPQSNYQNMQAVAGGLDQPNYQNVSVGLETVPLVLTSAPQDGHESYANLSITQNYANLALGPASPRPTELVSTPHAVSHSANGYGSYAELDLSSSITTITSPHGSIAASMAPIAELHMAVESVDGGKMTLGGANGEVAIAERPKDKEEVNYGSLDFGAMKELERMQKERELLKQVGGEPMSREKDRSISAQNHKKQK